MGHGPFSAGFFYDADGFRWYVSGRQRAAGRTFMAFFSVASVFLHLKRRRHVVSALVACSTCVAADGTAQDMNAAGALRDARCDSVVAGARADTVPSALFLAVKRVDGGELATAQITDMLLGVGAAFTPPKPFRLTVFSGPVVAPSLRRLAQNSEPTLRSPTLTGAYRVKTNRDGAFASLETTRISLMPGFDSAMMTAIRAAGDIPGLFAPRDGTPSATIDFRLSTDSVSGPGWTVRRIVSTVFPRMPVTDAVSQGGSAAAELPPMERRDSVVAETVLRFVVDRTGEPIMETVEIVRGTSIDFVRAALTVLAKQRFVPAQIQGCSVAQVVEYPFTLPPLSATAARPPSTRDRY